MHSNSKIIKTSYSFTNRTQNILNSIKISSLKTLTLNIDQNQQPQTDQQESTNIKSTHQMMLCKSLAHIHIKPIITFQFPFQTHRIIWTPKFPSTFSITQFPLSLIPNYLFAFLTNNKHTQLRQLGLFEHWNIKYETFDQKLAFTITNPQILIILLFVKEPWHYLVSYPFPLNILIQQSQCNINICS